MSYFSTFAKGLRRFVFGNQAHQKFHVGLKKFLKKELGVNPRPILKAIHEESARIKIRDKDFAKDDVSQAHLEFVSKVLAAYTILNQRFNDKAHTIDFMKRAMMKGFDTPSMNLALGAMLNSSKNNPSRLRKVFSWLMKQYGTTFDWEAKETDDGSFTLTISRCFYCNYFKSQDMIELTPILCQLDGLWFDKIDPQKHGYHFDRAGYQTQGLGAPICTFPIKSK